MTQPTILLAILAKQQAPLLPLYLSCIEAQDYPKDKIVLWIRTNNNTDDTAGILARWVARVGAQYDGIHFDYSNYPQPVQQWTKHDWAHPERFAILNAIRDESLQATLTHACDAYFVSDCDNFLRPKVLSNMVANLQHADIAAPLLRCCDPVHPNYLNCHGDIDAGGWYAPSQIHDDLLSGDVEKAFVPVVHCTYMVAANAIPHLHYEDHSGRYDYVNFSHSARRAGIKQLIDGSQDYGCLTFEDGPDNAQKWFKEREMKSRKTRVCCTMIVRNEAHVIARCLKSAAPLVDCVCIVDTGSTDKTRKVAIEELGYAYDHRDQMDWVAEDGEASFFSRPWVDFAHNRTEALRLAEAAHNLTADDYHLLIDADDHFDLGTHKLTTGQPGPIFLRQQDELAVYRSKLAAGDVDAFFLNIHHGSTRYSRLCVLRADGTWRFTCPVHEYPERVDGLPTTNAPLSWPIYVFNGDGARSKDSAKYAKDAALLQRTIDADPAHPMLPRLTFYLAQSYRDAGQSLDALDCYRLRYDMTAGWAQERYMSCLNLAALVGDPAEKRDWLTRAFYLDPRRAEAPYKLAKLLTDNASDMTEEPHQGLLWAALAASMPEPAGVLFAEPACYGWAKNLAQQLHKELVSGAGR